MKLLRIKLDDALHARLKVQCAMDQVSMQQYCVDCIDSSLEEAKSMLQQSQSNPRSNAQEKGE